MHQVSTVEFESPPTLGEMARALVTLIDQCGEDAEIRVRGRIEINAHGPRPVSVAAMHPADKRTR
jgi:hypothetical protein